MGRGGGSSKPPEPPLDPPLVLLEIKVNATKIKTNVTESKSIWLAEILFPTTHLEYAKGKCNVMQSKSNYPSQKNVFLQRGL